MKLLICIVICKLGTLSTFSPHTYVKHTLGLCYHGIQETESTLSDFIYKRGISALLRAYGKCVSNYWNSCLNLKMIVSSTITQYNISERPCWFGSLHLGGHDFSLHIEVNQRFQINLTFTHFHLNHYMSQCKYHYIQVKVLQFQQ